MITNIAARCLRLQVAFLLALVLGFSAAPQRAEAFGGPCCSCVTVEATLSTWDTSWSTLTSSVTSTLSGLWLGIPSGFVYQFTRAAAGISSAARGVTTSGLMTGGAKKDKVSDAVFQSRTAAALSAEMADIRPSYSVCMGLARKVDSAAAAQKTEVLDTAAVQDNAAKLTGNNVLTAGGPVSTATGQFTRIASKFYNATAWGACPSGLTCGAAPDPLGGTMAGKNLNPQEIIFSRPNIVKGTVREEAATLWADLVLDPVPPAFPKGDELATQPGRERLVRIRSYAASMSIPGYVVREIINDRLVDPAAGGGPPPKSEYEEIYRTTASQDGIIERNLAAAKEDDAQVLDFLSSEIDRVNVSYWSLFEQLEKISLLKAAELKALLDDSAAGMTVSPTAGTGRI